MRRRHRHPTREQTRPHIVYHSPPTGPANALMAIPDPVPERRPASGDQILPFKEHRATIRLLDAGCDGEEGRAPRAPRSPDGHKFADIDLKRHVAQHLDPPRATHMRLPDRP